MQPRLDYFIERLLFWAQQNYSLVDTIHHAKKDLIKFDKTQIKIDEEIINDIYDNYGS